jgi:hypothetical protein
MALPALLETELRNKRVNERLRNIVYAVPSKKLIRRTSCGIPVTYPARLTIVSLQLYGFFKSNDGGSYSQG